MNPIRTSVVACFSIAINMIDVEDLYAIEEPASRQAVKISTDFPGGNVKVLRHENNTVHVEPDLRGDKPWFYWYFEATSIRPGAVKFAFPKKVLGFENGAIGFQGPAISQDAGKTWTWMGTKNVDGHLFTYHFDAAGQSVRFAVTIPYVQSDLDRFCKRHRTNQHFHKTTLTKSNQGRDVELLQIGESAPGKKNVLITARHHAVETIASYVLEGLMEEAVSESEAGKTFRQNHCIFIVPFVDKDGVEKGDQGKNRKPYDHNRDYGENSIYPEVKAIKSLHAQNNFKYALDIHCPTLVMKDHQVMYFVGAKKFPPNNLLNVQLFAERIKNGLPADAPHGPLVWLRDEDEFSPKCSRYFGFQPGVIMSATLEVPFAPPKKKTDPASCREYGRVILKAFTESKFVEK